MEEHVLIAALKNGEAQAFSQLVSLYQDIVYHTAFSLLQHEADVEDVTQDVFMTVYESIHDFRGASRLSTWLYRIAVTKSLEWLRRKRRKKRFALLQSLDELRDTAPAWEAPHQQHPGAALEEKERAALLQAAIARLPEQQRVAFLLSQAEQLSQAEIAAVLETTVSAVESLLFRGKKRLRELLANYYDTHYPTGSRRPKQRP